MMQNDTQHRSRWYLAAGCVCLLFGVYFVQGCTSLAVGDRTYEDVIPTTPREFRAVWVATVANIDWPSEPGLLAGRQKSELRAILDRAASLNLNAIVLQVRPAADALYDSELEPWSEFLTGQMGKPPTPYYDPLAFAVEEAHRRGLELHAWFNPFRARHRTSFSPIDSGHVSRWLPEAVLQYGEQLWLDPGNSDARLHSLNVILDVVRRYDIDGIHMDDYFYPYHLEDSLGQTIPFPDTLSFAVAGGTENGMVVNDWRRSNVDRFIEALYNGVKSTKPHVKVGISPFGIWRPGHPPQIEGYDAYDRLYADSRKWLRNGWVDYFTPQLYWEIDKPEQSYTALLAWWDEQNTMKRHLWPGNFTSRVAVETSRWWTPQEILDQIIVTRDRAGATGNVHFSMRALMKDPSAMGQELAGGPYRTPALVPSSRWLSGEEPQTPAAEWDDLRNRHVVTFSSDEPVWMWVIKARERSKWSTYLLPGWRQSFEFGGRRAPERVVVKAVNRTQVESEPVELGRRE